MKVGSLVECVDSNESCDPIKYPCVIPTVKRVYTIRDVGRFKGKYGVVLEEITNGKIKFTTGFEEPYFPIEWFRELLPPISNIEEHIKENSLEPVLK